MARVKPAARGVTLLDLIISVVIGTIVLFAASKLLINFGNFSANFVKAESSLVGTATGAYEEIVGKITRANKVTFPAPGRTGTDSIRIQVSPAGPASSDHTNDVLHEYWQENGEIRYKTGVGSIPNGSGMAIAGDIRSLSFAWADADHQNKVTVQVQAKSASGAAPAGLNLSTETLSTTAVMREKGSQSFVPAGCVPQCSGKACGDNGCGGVCGLCTSGTTCNASFQCEPEVRSWSGFDCLACPYGYSDEGCAGYMCNVPPQCTHGVTLTGRDMACDGPRKWGYCDIGGNTYNWTMTCN